MSSEAHSLLTATISLPALMKRRLAVFVTFGSTSSSPPICAKNVASFLTQYSSFSTSVSAGVSQIILTFCFVACVNKREAVCEGPIFCSIGATASAVDFLVINFSIIDLLTLDFFVGGNLVYVEVLSGRPFVFCLSYDVL